MSLVTVSYVTVWRADSWVIVAIPIRFASSVKPPRRATRTARSTTWGEYRRSVDPNALLALINRLSLAVHLPTGTLARASLLVPSSTTRSNCTTRGTRKPHVTFFFPASTADLASRSLKCWNGPERSVKLDLSCGTNNELLHISEPEKCEYYFKATSPALCWPLALEGPTTGSDKRTAEHHVAHQDL